MRFASASEPFDERDLPVAMEIGRRCALFLESARLRGPKSAPRWPVTRCSRSWPRTFAIHSGSFMMQLSLLQPTHGRPEPRSLKAVNALERAVMRMSRILKDLVEITKVESGHLNLGRTQVPAADFIVEVIEALRQEASSLSLDLHGDVPRHVPDVWVDKRRILQVFENLVDNAMKFTPRAASLWARAPRAAKSCSGSRTRARYPGRGSPSRLRPGLARQEVGASRIGARARDRNGIVQAHGGRVWVDSKVGVGEHLLFSLPMGPV